jgi:putative peptidoglycan lipid II flippase
MSTETSNAPPQSANRQIARAAGVVTLAFILSQLTGLARQILVANAFGTSPAMEAFTAANRVSETLFLLVAGGALGSAFIPTFSNLLSREGEERAWELTSAILNLALVILIILCVIAGIFAPQIVRYIIAPGFSTNPEQEMMAIKLTRLMLPSVVLFGLSGIVMSILNAKQIFFIPALTPAMYQIGMIFGVLVLSPSLGIYGLAWGVVIGAGFHLLLQIPSLLKLNGTYTPALGLHLQPVRKVARLLGPRLIGVAVVQLNFWVNIHLASKQPVGSVVAISLAFTLMLMPQAAIAQSIATAALPTFSTQVAENQQEDMRRSLAATLRGTLLLTLPATVGLILLRTPIITLLYQRGEFTSNSTSLVAWALLWYALGLVSHSMVEILSRAFYALHDTKTPVIVGSLAMTLNVLLSITLSSLFERLGWMPHGGLALANTVATSIEMIGLLLLMRKRLQGLFTREDISGILKGIAASTVMGAALWIWLENLSGSSAWITAGGGILLGLAIYSIGMVVFGVKDAQQVMRYLKDRFQTAW